METNLKIQLLALFLMLCFYFFVVFRFIVFVRSHNEFRYLDKNTWTIIVLFGSFIGIIAYLMLERDSFKY